MKSLIVFGFEGGEDIVIIYTNNNDVIPEMISLKFSQVGAVFETISEICKSQIQYYIYEPLWLTEVMENHLIENYARENKNFRTFEGSRAGAIYLQESPEKFKES